MIRKAIAKLFGIQASENAYKGGARTRMTKDWLPPHRSGDGAIHGDWDLMTSRIRDQIRNEPAIIAAGRVLADHCIGQGLRASAAVTLPTGEAEALDLEFNTLADDLFDEWAMREVASDGSYTFAEMQRLALLETANVGETLWLECIDKDRNRSLPLCYQLLEAEQIDLTKDRLARNGENEIRRGVELDNAGRAVAFYLYGAHPADPFGTFDNQSQRIPAARVLHYFNRTRPGETRGVSWWRAAMLPARDRDWLIGNVLSAAAIQAIFTLVLKSAHPSGSGLGLVESGDSSTTDDAGNNLFKLGKGIINEIGADDDVQGVNPTQPGPNLPPFYDVIHTEHSMATGISALRNTRDYSRTNYSSARAAHNDDFRTFAPISRSFGQRVVVPIRERFTAMAASLGRFNGTLRPEVFRTNPRRWLRTKLILPGRLQLDEMKEDAAAIRRIAAGLSTWTRELEKRGEGSFEDLIRERKREVEMIEASGLTFDLSTQGAGSDRFPEEPEEPAAVTGQRGAA